MKTQRVMVTSGAVFIRNNLTENPAGITINPLEKNLNPMHEGQ